MYVICSEVRFVEISSPNECDKILKIPNEQTEPTDYMANCSTDYEVMRAILLVITLTHRHSFDLLILPELSHQKAELI